MRLQSTINRSTSIIFSVPFTRYLSYYLKTKKPSKTLYVVDTHMYPKIQPMCGKKNTSVIVLQAGEQKKNIETFTKIVTFFYNQGIDKKSVIVAFGGGMISDVAGFAASVYFRGIPLIIIPTSLLAQVDAGIGGKNTINFLQTKNVLGTTYLPSRIIIDTSLLSTLPQKELSSGMAEIIKYAIGFDKRLFTMLDQRNDIHRILPALIKRCVEIKSTLVSQDLYEERNKRKLLNLGHTLGQALESEDNYSLSHGEAVSIGLLFSAYISYQLRYLTKNEFNGVMKLFHIYQLPPIIDFSTEKIIQKMKHDKKYSNNAVDFVILKRLGKAAIRRMPIAQLRRYLNQFQHIYHSQ